ncbi:DUF3017 domain-containing protein [Kitasatospora kifunensis]|uniref:DUF3017 domain-containing protein n=1 Tax=Kitasatospora kifunensis TaxID=58351 RepID=A0A7W7R514_KITKI|nr:DUF3017 domain-containing protein [Kitasatospora kifunensis]MBB4925298.1 hypothetical protein [Kitasatospora kifunensis]
MSALRTGRSTRRRPARTTGTLPPEGSKAALGRDHSLPVRQWPITLVLAVVGIGLAITWRADFRYGLLVIGGAMLLGALLRLLLPEVGMLAVRSRFTDVLVLLCFATVIVMLALVAQPDPWLRLPQVEDIGTYIGQRH